MTPEEEALLAYTVSHFQEVARQNRFPENDTVPHDTDRCAICHPELLPMDPFDIYLEVVAQSVKARRPALDRDFIELLNNDLALMGESANISRESLLAGEKAALAAWRDWVRDALATGLGLLSIHASNSHEFDLDEAEAAGAGPLIEEKIRELMACQRLGDLPMDK